MKTRWVTACALALLLLAGCRGCRRRSLPVEAALDDLVVSHVKPGEPGYAVLVARGGQLVLRRGYGLAQIAGDRAWNPMTPEHAFQVGPITKQFTAAAIWLLAGEGKLSLDDELARWCPRFPPMRGR